MLSERYAGILLHITSLPGPAYIGDIGPAAVKFAEFLHEGRQRYWQLLPVQPVSADQGYSPYSSSSAVAGSPLLISPELLVAEDYLVPEDLEKNSGKLSSADYKKAGKYKQQLLDKAFNKWLSLGQREEFDKFCAQEAYWLDDFAAYTVIKQRQGGKAWVQWPEALRDRDKAALQEFVRANDYDISKEKWIQMIFDKQWKKLREHCHSLQIELIGDVPFYVGYDSADVWSHRNIFDIDEQGKIQGVAGVPPDLFNDEGQLWGMPLFKWDVLKQRNYDWWITRFKKNFEFFDVLRIDHFRAFSSYWSVPADSRTAKTGSWLKGPGLEFFHSLKQALGDLPFVAEDLGEIDEPVYELRDALNLPGMNVLQFAFGEDMPASPYLPHNHIYNSIVYTGTHDNDTTRGWYATSPKLTKGNLSEYLNSKVNNKNIASQLCRLAYMSVARLAILPMQDVLGLDGSARMNMPASPDNNWRWRLEPDQMSASTAATLKHWTEIYGRTGKRQDGR